MVVAINRHTVKWLSPSSVWGEFGEFKTEADRDKFAQPNILRFNNDMFMDELLSVMTYYPDKLSEWKAQQETWRQPMGAPKTAVKLILTEPLSALNKTQKRQIEKYNQAKSTTSTNQNGNKKSRHEPPLEGEPLKLYQPSQQRYYLVSASLVCQQRGLPDRVVDAGRQEQVGFVLRRLLPKTNSETALFDCLADPEHVNACDEYAFVQTENGSQWKNFSDSVYEVDQVMAAEELLPMFSIAFSDLDNRKRRLHAGLIPVAKREAYMTAPKYEENSQGDNAGENSVEDNVTAHKRDALRSLFVMQVAAPWKALVEQAAHTRMNLTDGLRKNFPAEDDYAIARQNANKVVKTSREQIQTLSWYVLLDFANFIERHLPNVWDVIWDSNLINTLDSNESGKAFYNVLAETTINRNNYDNRDDFINSIYQIEHFTEDKYNLSDIKLSLLDALIAVKGGSPFNKETAKDLETKLEFNEDSYERDANDAKIKWPPFLFPLADPYKNGPVPFSQLADPNVDQIHSYIDELTNLVARAVLITDDEAPEVVSFTPSPDEPKLSLRDAVFVIRCIYQRPNCGPFNPAVVSEPTEPFQMASFFDPDAPGRQILIPSPIDVSPAGLRKFNKNTTFMISDMLCGKLSSIRELTFGDLVLSVLPWPFHKDLPEPTGPASCGGNNPFGMFCSLSIPIVTICAMVLLIIMVALFDLFFRWIPLLFVCLPIPGFRGKKP